MAGIQDSPNAENRYPDAETCSLSQNGIIMWARRSFEDFARCASGQIAYLSVVVAARQENTSKIQCVARRQPSPFVSMQKCPRARRSSLFAQLVSLGQTQKRVTRT